MNTCLHDDNYPAAGESLCPSCLAAEMSGVPLEAWGNVRRRDRKEQA